MTRQAHPIEKLFPELTEAGEEDFKAMGTVEPVLMIAMTARSGSSHLCSGLASVFSTAMPTELFNGRDTMVWEKKRRNVSTFAEFLAQYYAERTNQIIFKTSWCDFEFFQDKIFLLFPNTSILYLNRLDTEAQAVSLFKAIVSGKWHDTRHIAPHHTVSDDELRGKFDLARICQWIVALEREKASWEEFFFKYEIQPARVNYEGFKDDLNKAIRQILRHNAYPPVNTSTITSEYKKLSDAINDEWLTLVRNYRNGNFYYRYMEANRKPEVVANGAAERS